MGSLVLDEAGSSLDDSDDSDDIDFAFQKTLFQALQLLRQIRGSDVRCVFSQCGEGL